MHKKRVKQNAYVREREQTSAKDRAGIEKKREGNNRANKADQARKNER